MSIKGKVRLGRSTKRLVPNLLPGEIAIISHEDVDRLNASGLVKSQVKAVINAKSFITGIYPNSAPQIILQNNIPIIDDVGEEIFDKLHNGDLITIDGSNIYHDGQLIAEGTLLTNAIVEQRMQDASANMKQNLENFVSNTAEYLKNEGGELLYSNTSPEIECDMSSRPALVVVRGPDYVEDLAILRSYISELKPAIIAVDGAADGLIDLGYKPDVIVGDMDSVSDSALMCGAEIIPHAYEDGTCLAKGRLDKLGVEYKLWALTCTSEDLGLLLAWEKDADLIVAVGTHTNVIEYMEKNRQGMASTFLVRLRVGTKLVDAKGVSKLYRPAPPGKYLFLVILAALSAILATIFISEPLRNTLAIMWLTLRTTLGF